MEAKDWNYLYYIAVIYQVYWNGDVLAIDSLPTRVIPHQKVFEFVTMVLGFVTMVLGFVTMVLEFVTMVLGFVTMVLGFSFVGVWL